MLPTLPHPIICVPSLNINIGSLLAFQPLRCSREREGKKEYKNIKNKIENVKLSLKLRNHFLRIPFSVLFN